MPPLRERLGDISALAEHFASRASLRFGLSLVKPTEEDVLQLQNYSWPGNIRELGAVIDRAAILGEGRSLEIGKSLGVNQPINLKNQNWNLSRGVHVQQHEIKMSPSTSPNMIATLDEAMKTHIELALKATGGRIEGHKGAAAILGINPHTLRARMRKLGINWGSFRDADTPL